jgi:hypothetical protein
MKLGWYINRLRSMEPAELLHRLHEKRRKVASRDRDEGWDRHLAPQLRAVFPALPEAMGAASPAQRQAIATAAEETLAGRFTALGRTWGPRDPKSLFSPELWRFDPVTGGSWPGPAIYTFDIDFRHGGYLGDIKYVWEINRLQMLPPLAAHLLLENDSRSLNAIQMAIDSWHSANPPFRGVGWASGIEVALRAISLIVTLDLVGDRLSWKTRKQAGEILAASAYWLPRFPSKFSSANNHLVAELAGEYLLGLAFGADVQVAREAILAELDRQIFTDGSGAEQSPTYAAFTAELVLLCALASQWSDAPFLPAVEERLGAFADFAAWLGPKTKGFGDDDEGRVLRLGDERDYVRSVAAAIRGLLQQPGMTPDPDDFRALFFGMPSGPAPAPRGLRTFAQGGLSVWHGEIIGRHLDLTLDHGPLGYLSIAAHGHADALSLTLDIDGEPVLVDPGTWLYGASGPWRNWFRSTPAHNTLNIDGANQSIIAGSFNWSHKAVTTLAESRSGADWRLVGRHDGYRRRFGVLHQRIVTHQADGIMVTDQLIGGGRVAEIVFQLAAGLAVERERNVVLVRRDRERLLAIHFPDDAITVASGGTMPGQGGWVSPRFGVKSPAERLVWRGEVGDAGVKTLLRPMAMHHSGDAPSAREMPAQPADVSHSLQRWSLS